MLCLQLKNKVAIIAFIVGLVITSYLWITYMYKYHHNAGTPTVKATAPAVRCNITKTPGPARSAPRPPLEGVGKIQPVITEDERIKLWKSIQFNIKVENGMKVPNVVHFNWYNDKPVEFAFHKMLSVLSAHKHIKPDAILFHTNMPPKGKYWEMLKNLTNFRVIHRKRPILKNVNFIEIYSDFDRVLLLKTYGGIYLDLDVMVIRSFNDLRKYSCTLGEETPFLLGSGIIVCSKDSSFLDTWLNSFFDDYHAEWWAYNANIVPSKIARRFPRSVHVERALLLHPNYLELNKIWGNTHYDWRKNYAIHSYIRLAPGHAKNPDPESIKRLKNTYGQLARLVYYGSADIIH